MSSMRRRGLEMTFAAEVGVTAAGNNGQRGHLAPGKGPSFDTSRTMNCSVSLNGITVEREVEIIVSYPPPGPK